MNLKETVNQLIEFKKQLDNNTKLQREIRIKGEEYQRRYSTLTKDALYIIIESESG